MSRTTREAPYDVEELFAFLKGTARQTLRLHPERKANVSPMVSKVGGAFAWPAGEAQPTCEERGCRAVPVVQLRKDDVPSIEFPPGCDLCQLLWYPEEYPDWGYNPKVEVYWRDLVTLGRESVIGPNDPSVTVVSICMNAACMWRRRLSIRTSMHSTNQSGD